MKKVLAVIFVCMLIPAASYADSKCAIVADTAKLMMISRQKEVPLQTIIELNNTLEENTPAEKFFKNLVMTLAIDAYDSPLYNSEEYKQTAIVEFSNKYMIKCLKGE